MSSGIFFISMAARELGMHPQTLRKYERLGLVRPTRTIGSMRMYSVDEIRRLRAIKRLVDELGINLAGVQHLLSVAEIVERIRPLIDADEAEAEADDAHRRAADGGGRGRAVGAAPRGPQRRRALRREVDRLSRLLGF